MTKLYLITGFLGAGKTTFLHQFVKLFPKKRLALVVNEFGKVGVDGALLSGLGAELTEIDNGSIFCACKLEQFEEALLALLEKNLDLIFVEASGLSDPTSVRSILGQREKFGAVEYAGAVCLVDAARFQKVYQTARVCRMQLAVSDLVLINKADLGTPEQIAAIRTIVTAQKPGRPVYETTYGHIEAVWLEEMARPLPDSGIPEIHTKDLTLQKLNLAAEGFDLKSITSFLRMFAEDTYRIKGVLALPEGQFLADCVGPLVEVKPFDPPSGGGPVPEKNRLTVLFSNGLPAKRSIKEAASWFPQCTVELR